MMACAHNVGPRVASFDLAARARPLAARLAPFYATKEMSQPLNRFFCVIVVRFCHPSLPLI